MRERDWVYCGHHGNEERCIPDFGLNRGKVVQNPEHIWEDMMNVNSK